MLYYSKTSTSVPKKSYTPTPQKIKSSFEEKSKNQKIFEAKDIASRVETEKDLDSLYERIYNTQDKIDEYDDRTVMCYQAEKELEILEMALEYAKDNPYRYCYAYYVHTHTPLAELKFVGKLFSSQEHSRIIKEHYKLYFVQILLIDEEYAQKESQDVQTKIKDIENCCFNNITKYELNELMEFRKIIEADNIDEATEKTFNKLVSKSKFIQNDLDLSINDKNSLYDQCKRRLIQRETIKHLSPCPCAKKFVENGYETLDEIFKLSDKEILAIKGIGIKNLEKVRNFQNNSKVKRKVKSVHYRPILKRYDII